MKNKLISKIVIMTMLVSVGTTIIIPTISAKANTLSNVENVVEKELVDFLKKYNLKESEMKDFMTSVSKDLNNPSMNEKGSVSTIKNALKIILKYADKLPSWVSKPLKKLFGPLMAALDKVVDISLSGLKKIMISLGFNPTVAEFIIDIIDLFFL